MDPTEETSFFVTLSSRSSESNNAGDFTTRLGEPLVLPGEWRVALTRIITDHNWINIEHTKGRVLVFHPHPSGTEKIHQKYRTLYLETIASGILDKYKNTPASPETSNYRLTNVPLRPGYYANPGEIGGSIQRDIVHISQAKDGPELSAKFKYERNERSFSLSGPTAFVFEDAEPFIKALGIENPATSVDDIRKMYFGPLVGRYGKLPGVVDTLYLYSELLFDRNIVGDVKTHFVTAVPVSGSHGDTMHYEPINPEYKKVLKRKEISEIDIKIRDVFGEPVKYEPGSETLVVLHFKRVEPLD